MYGPKYILQVLLGCRVSAREAGAAVFRETSTWFVPPFRREIRHYGDMEQNGRVNVDVYSIFSGKKIVTEERYYDPFYLLERRVVHENLTARQPFRRDVRYDHPGSFFGREVPYNPEDETVPETIAESLF